MQRDKAYQFIFELVELLLKKDGSDIFITAGAAPAIKFNDEIHRVSDTKLTREQTESLTRSIMNDRQSRAFDAEHEANFALNLRDIARFRVSAFHQRGSTGMVMRHIKSTVASIEQLGLPPLLSDLAMEKRGLVLVTGATSSGKSATLAAMLDHRNEHAADHIITLEDPIEYFHRHKRSLVTQREVGTDAESYAIGLKNALRQTPNVLMIGEIRDRPTMEAALNFAETGHLVLASLHSSSTDQTFDRILNLFPSDKREQVLMDLAFNLRAIIAQRLVPRADQQGTVAAIEILLKTPLVGELIFQNRIQDIKDALAKSSEQGLVTFNQALFALYEAGKIGYETALRHADSVNDLRLTIRLQSKRPKPSGLGAAGHTLQIDRESRSQRLRAHAN